MKNNIKILANITHTIAQSLLLEEHYWTKANKKIKLITWPGLSATIRTNSPLDQFTIVMQNGLL